MEGIIVLIIIAVIFSRVSKAAKETQKKAETLQNAKSTAAQKKQNQPVLKTVPPQKIDAIPVMRTAPAAVKPPIVKTPEIKQERPALSGEEQRRIEELDTLLVAREHALRRELDQIEALRAQGKLEEAQAAMARLSESVNDHIAQEHQQHGTQAVLAAKRSEGSTARMRQADLKQMVVMREILDRPVSKRVRRAGAR